MSRRPRLSLPPPPDAGACLSYAAQALRRRPALLLGLALGVAAAHAGVAQVAALSPAGTLVGVAMGVFLLVPLGWGVSFVGLRVARGGRANASDGLRVLDNYREVVAAQVLVWIAIGAGLACFVVPGIWLYARTRYVAYLVVEEELDAAAAITESVRLTRGHTAAILGISLAGVLATALGAALAGLGIVPALLWWDLALASLYHATVQPTDAWEPASGLARPALSY
jgi:hypothetical protein